jgi:hypothetical protein
LPAESWACLAELGLEVDTSFFTPLGSDFVPLLLSDSVAACALDVRLFSKTFLFGLLLFNTLLLGLFSTLLLFEPPLSSLLLFAPLLSNTVFSAPLSADGRRPFLASDFAAALARFCSMTLARVSAMTFALSALEGSSV